MVNVESTDPRIIKALGHPTRIEILRALEHGEASSVEIAKRLGLTPGSVSYHFNQLRELGLIELRRTTPRRGALERHYGSAGVDTSDIERAPAQFIQLDLDAEGRRAVSDEFRKLRKRLQQIERKSAARGSTPRETMTVAVLAVQSTTTPEPHPSAPSAH